MNQDKYHIEDYWDKVALFLKKRKENTLLAGDDEPYYAYKRKLFLLELDKINFENQNVLEFGCGPGGNLYYLLSRKCKRIVGVDISENMINIAMKNLDNTSIEIKKIDGIYLPFEDNTFDIVLTSTVLQHIVDNEYLEKVIKEICRVSKRTVIIFERTEKVEKIETSNYGRTPNHYMTVFEQNNFKLQSISFLKIKISYYLCGISRKLFDYNKSEGEKPSFLNYNLQNLILFFTKKIDKLFSHQRDLTKMEFIKISL